MTAPRDWSDMMTRWAELLERRTGAGLSVWNQRVLASGADRDEDELRRWLASQGVTGYAQNLLVMERFGYPDFFTAGADELIDAQYADRPHLRPILDRLLAVTGAIGRVTVQARKGYVALVGPRRTFAVIRPTTKQRVDLGMRLDGHEPQGRLEAAKGLGSDTINLRVSLLSESDVDDEVTGLLETAYRRNI